MAAGADHIFAIKGNQGTDYEDLYLLFEGFVQANYEGAVFETARSHSQAHGRNEFRQVFVVKEIRLSQLFAARRRLEGLKISSQTPDRAERRSKNRSLYKLLHQQLGCRGNGNSQGDPCPLAD